MRVTPVPQPLTMKEHVFYYTYMPHICIGGTFGPMAHRAADSTGHNSLVKHLQRGLFPPLPLLAAWQTLGRTHPLAGERGLPCTCSVTNAPHRSGKRAGLLACDQPPVRGNGRRLLAIALSAHHTARSSQKKEEAWPCLAQP